MLLIYNIINEKEKNNNSFRKILLTSISFNLFQVEQLNTTLRTTSFSDN